jgi:hypothetical protein
MPHTPGPWRTRPQLTQVYGREGDQRLIASCGVSAHISKEEKAANTLLIAAAPDLLAACQAFVDAMNAGRDGDASHSELLMTALDRADAAIAKAQP